MHVDQPTLLKTIDRASKRVDRAFDLVKPEFLGGPRERSDETWRRYYRAHEDAGPRPTRKKEVTSEKEAMRGDPRIRGRAPETRAHGKER
jgi:hypothetical protein